MINRKLLAGLVLSATLFSAVNTLAALVDFTGSFSGFYAPGNWATTISGSSGYLLAPSVITAGAPNNVTLIGSLGTGSVPNPPTFLDYSIAIGGTSASFTYTFFNPATGAGNVAQVLDNGVVVANLDPAQTQVRLIGVFTPGDTLDLRLTSVNINQFDFLQISPIPEPSTLALAGLGGAALLLNLRRKSARS